MKLCSLASFVADDCDSSFDGDKIPECPVCLQNCIHPVRLPCQHIFCFLCVKGAANQSKRCALCRQEIPVDFLNNPSLLRKEDLLKENFSEDGLSWFYEGRNGWWLYDERTSQELEDRYKRDVKVFDLLIAGFLYVIDLDNMLQVRRNDPTRRRRIKRDRKDIPKKGVAGLKINETSDRDGADGIDSEEQTSRDSANANVVRRSNAAADASAAPVTDRRGSTPTRSGPTSPTVPHNTPQSPSAEGSPNRETPPSQRDQELSAQMENLSLGSERQRGCQRVPCGIPQLGSPTSDSDSDWD